MQTPRTICIALLLICCQIYQAQVQKYIRRAENSVDRGNLREAILYLNKALEKDPQHQKANMELGLVYSELLDNYKSALPYLEKAFSQASSDSLYDLMFALAKSYHYSSDFEKALSFYERLKDVQDLENESDFQKELVKRKQDCEYAMSRQHALPDDNIYMVNAGRQVNTDMPEYVPVLTGNNELLFTSKRKDDNKEELNYLDGKYFESMYLTKILPNGFSPARRYTLPDKLMNSKFYKHHQAVVSLSQDGKKLFTFRDSKLYEIGVGEREVAAPAEVKINQFNHYQNHAFLTQDGTTLFFTSDVGGGLGGTDIYTSTKNSNGEWGTPKNLGAPINTAFDEDAPFLAKDGTLYFASEGHQGFGNYDIYRSYLLNGQWSVPENLGAPVNTTAHDIFLVTDSSSSLGYFSSGRAGGFGDMDIYKIVYLEKIKKECPEPENPLLRLSVKDNDTSDFKNTVEVLMPSNYYLLQSEWFVEKDAVTGSLGTMEHDYKQTGKFNVHVKLMAGCDTCMMPVQACPSMLNIVEKMAPPVLASQSPAQTKREPDLAQQTETKKDKDQKTNEVTKTETGEHLNSDSKTSRVNKEPATTKEPFRTKIVENKLTLHFDFNKASLLKNEEVSMDSLAKVLRSVRGMTVTIVGYADARGSAAANQSISVNRARAAKQFLLQKGIGQKTFDNVQGKGASNFVNHCAEGVSCEENLHAANRRVEIMVKLRVPE